MPTNAWTPLPNLLPRTFQRQLGRNELAFYFASQFNGTTDCFQTAIVQDLEESGSNHGLFNPENVSRAWIRLKQRFPLLGSRVGVGKDGRQVLIVEEGSLGDTSPAEITFQTVSSEEQALARICDLVDSERVLSDGMLARLVILSRTDLENQIHVLIQIAHLITDGMSNASILRSFLDVLSSPSGPDKEWDLDKSLELALSQETLTSATNLSRQRWHRAIGQVISEIRASKSTGGHTLPRTFTDCTQYTLPRSELYDISFDEDKSAHIIESCRTHEVTFGQVLPVLGQVALARILCRRYLRGEMSIEEWNFRRRQPTYTGGPINLRPFLDNEWYEKGGATNVSLAIGYSRYTLPFLPLGSATDLSPGDDMPGFLELLSLPRFIFRANLIRKQARDLFNHPLFVHIAGARTVKTIDKFKEVGQVWREKQNVIIPTPIPVNKQGFVLAYAATSKGNMDRYLPCYYPLGDHEHPNPQRLKLLDSYARLHCRPAELYLTATTIQRKLHISVFWDGNVYEDSLVKEWLSEIQDATMIYLGNEA